MILKNNASRPISIGTGSADTSVKALVPGVNNFDQAEWDKLKKHPVIKHMLETKEENGEYTLVVVKEDKATPPASPGSEPVAPVAPTDVTKELKDLSSKDAKDAIKLVFDLEQLKSWLESETRAPVKKEIEAQIELVEKDNAEAQAKKDAEQA